MDVFEIDIEEEAPASDSGDSSVFNTTIEDMQEDDDHTQA